MRSVRLAPLFAFTLLAGLPLAAICADVPVAPVTPAPPLSARAIEPADKPVEGMGKRVDSAVLARLSGGNETTETMTLNGNVANNTVDHVVNGANVIGTGAFSGAMGLPMVIQNSGNGVLIQNATIVNVQFRP